MVFGRPHLSAGGFSWNAKVKNLLFCVFSFPVIGPVFYVSFLCLIVCVRVPLRAFRTRDLYGPGRWVFRRSSFCSPMDHRPNLLCWDKRLYKRINEFIEINLYLF